MSDVNLSISKEIVEPIIREKIQAAIFSELNGDPRRLIDGIVMAALDQRVDRDGRKTEYRHGPTYVEHLCSEAIRDAAKAAVRSWVEENTPLIREAVEREMGKKKGAMSRAFVTGLAKAMKQSWSFSVDVKLDTPRD